MLSSQRLPKLRVNPSKAPFATLSGAPVAGVLITVTGDGGFEGSSETDADGVWAVEVPEAGEYSVLLNEDTLPDGTTPPTVNPIATSADLGSARFINFRLGEKERNVQSRCDEVQLRRPGHPPK